MYYEIHRQEANRNPLLWIVTSCKPFISLHYLWFFSALVDVFPPSFTSAFSSLAEIFLRDITPNAAARR